MQEKITKSENILDYTMDNKFAFVFFILIFVLISCVLSLIQKNEYSSTAKILIIQEQNQNLDAYIASKASESISKTLKDAILSSSFRNSVLSEYSDESAYNFIGEKKKRKQWQKSVDAKIIPNTSILQIKTYDVSSFNSEKLLNNIISVLLEKHRDYHGGGDSIRLQIVDTPITSTYPVRPNWIVNLFMSFVLAIFFNISFIMLFPNRFSKFDATLNNFFSSKHKKAKQYGKVTLVFNQNTQIDESNNIIHSEKKINGNEEIDFNEFRKRIIERK